MGETNRASRLLVFFFVFTWAFVLNAARAEQFFRSPHTSWNFDWDDNIFYMPTEIRIWHKQTGEEIGVSTTEFAVIRELVGVTGKWADYEFREDRRTGSLRFFGDASSDKGIFLQDVLRALESPEQKWQGPSWEAFVRAMNTRSTARNTSIITARQHAPKTIFAALKELQRRGHIRHLPLLKNVFPVGYPGLDPRFRGESQSPSLAKTKVMEFLLDRHDDLPRNDRRLVLSRDGEGLELLNLWGFSDDDWGNYSTATKFLAEEVRKGRWPNTKLTVFFTGHNHPGEKPRIEVIQSDGTLRPLAPMELEEISHHLSLEIKGNEVRPRSPGSCLLR